MHLLPYVYLNQKLENNLKHNVVIYGMVNWCAFCKFYVPSKTELSRCIKHSTTAERSRNKNCINASSFERNQFGANTAKYTAKYYNPYVLNKWTFK